MLRIDFVYADDDVDTTQLRNNLRDALHMLDLAPRWTEWRVNHPELPVFAAGQPVPSVYVGERRIPGTGAPLPARATLMLAVQEEVARR